MNLDNYGEKHMTRDLKTECLGARTYTAEQVELIYRGYYTLSEPDLIRRLCLSHERLRAELEGAEILLKERT